MLNLGTSQHGDVLLPPDPTQKIALIGVSGCGKSFAAGRLVEQFVLAGVPVCTLDPVGLWYGLRTGSDGNPAHGAPVLILGGPHGDSALPPASVAAREFRANGTSMVIDLSEQTPEQMQLWAAEFGEALMAPGIGPCRPSHIVLEESRIFVPQTGSLSKHQRRCKSAWLHLSMVGGNMGYGHTLIAQRAASVDKNILNMCGTLLLLRVAAKMDRRTLLDWAAQSSSELDVDQVLSELGSLENGVGVLWAPTWATDPRTRYCRVRISERLTYHPKRTEFGLVQHPRLLQIPRGSWWRGWGSLVPAVAPVVKFLLLGTAILLAGVVLFYGLKFFAGAFILYVALKAHKG